MLPTESSLYIKFEMSLDDDDTIRNLPYSGGMFGTRSEYFLRIVFPTLLPF